MKYILVLLLAVLLFAGCGENGKNDQPAQNSENEYSFDSTALKTEPVDNPDQSFYLRYKFSPGEKLRYRVTSIMENKQHIEADTLIDQLVKQTVVYLIDAESMELDQDSVAELKMTIKSVKVNASANNESFAYETGTTKDSAEIEKFAEYAALVNNPFSVRLGKSGEIIEIFRADRIVNDYLKIKGYQDSLTAENKVVVKNQIIATGIKPLLSQIFRELPENKVAVDSTWNFVQPAARMLVFQVEPTTTYKITSLEEYNGDMIAVFDASLKTKVEGETKLTDRGINYEFKKPVMTAAGKVYFNLEDGLILKSKTDVTIAMANKMEFPSPKGTVKGSQTENQKIVYIVEKI